MHKHTQTLQEIVYILGPFSKHGGTDLITSVKYK